MTDEHASLIAEAKAACREAEAAQATALSLAQYKFTAVRAALEGGVRAVELAAALGLTRERCYRIARSNKRAKDLAL